MRSSWPGSRTSPRVLMPKNPELLPAFGMLCIGDNEIMKFFKYIIILPICILILTTAIFAEPRSGGATGKGQLIVIIKGIRYEQGGHIVVNLYAGKENWLKSGHEFSKMVLKVSGTNELQTIFTNIACNKAIAIEVFHDRNNNGKLDFQWFPPKPAEGVGVSNNHYGMGPPDFNDAKIYLKAKKMTIQINMHY